jgi:thioredoxin reductase
MRAKRRPRTTIGDSARTSREDADAMNDRVDVVIVGAGPAGLSAALHLLRAEKRVVLVDAGTPRNAPAAHIHGIVTRDGISPAALREAGLAELAHYPRFTHRASRVDEIGRRGAGFVARLGDGTSVEARRVLLATGVVDVLMKIPGLAEHWGSSIFDCAYCHGHELAGLAWGAINSKVAGLRGTVAYAAWTRDLVLFTHGETGIAPDVARDLERARVRIETRPIVAFHGERTEGGASVLTGVELEGGEIVPRRAIVYAPQSRPSDLALMMGLALGPDGFLRVDPSTRETSMRGIHATGDLAGGGMKALTSAADGMHVAHVLAHALTMEDVFG